MKQTVLFLAAAAALPFTTYGAAFTPGDFVVLRVGDGVSALGNSSGLLSLLEFNPAGSLIQTISIPGTDNGLQISGTATSEGQIVMNVGGQSLTVSGYMPPFTGTGSLSGRNTTQAPRGYVTVDSGGLVSATTILTGTYGGQNIRSGFLSGGVGYFTGSGTAAGTGLTYYNGTAVTTIQGINSRVINYYNGNLFYSTGSGTVGIYSYSGLPTSATTSTPFLTGVAGQGTSPYDFVFSPDGNSLYVADDGIGVQKFTYNGSAWSLAYNFTGAAAGGNRGYGLEVDFTGADPVLFWTTPTNVFKATDLGLAAAGTSILAADPNYAFRGLATVPQPVPEPGALVFALAGAASLYTVRRLQKRS